jgi:hypothetical protein
MTKTALFLKESVFYDVACILCPVPDSVRKMVRKTAALIPNEKIDTKAGGIEDNSHITVMYGVPDSFDMEKYCFPARITTEDRISYFENEQFTVAKISVESPDLKEIHDRIKSVEVNSHSYDYSPHITVAYLKKGERLENMEGIRSCFWIQKRFELQRNGLIDVLEMDI